MKAFGFPIVPASLQPHAASARLIQFTSPADNSRVGLGETQDWRRHSTGTDTTWMDDPLSRHMASAGVMMLSKEHPQEIRYRSGEPVLTPESAQERHGTVSNVVFPTGIDRRDDIGQFNRFDVYYGMADSRIGVALLEMPEHLPQGMAADPPDTTFSDSSTEQSNALSEVVI